MTQPDIQILLITGASELTESICASLADYRQVGFGVVRADDVASATEAIKDRDIELAVIDTCPASGVALLREFLAAENPVPVIAVTGDDPNEAMSLGASDHVHASKIGTNAFPKALVMQWVQSKHQTEEDERAGGDVEDSPESEAIVEEQRDLIERVQRVEVTFAAIMPEDERTYLALKEEERLELKLQLVQTYIDITKIYFARGDEESEELIRKFCAHLASLRYPPRELTSIHMAALELMLTEPGQQYRRGLISQNRLVFIDILLNLLSFYYSFLAETESERG
ncbi:MAG: response regulator [Planctomycetota bacterium]|nr:response regulator [Planctomycetota bacterium]MDA1138618.1 response regulator [Planctomycetota bacterium]